MHLNVDPGFDSDLERAQRAVERGWLTREGVEAAILTHERTPGSRLLSFLPLTPEQRLQLDRPAPAKIPPEAARAGEDPARRVDDFILVEHLSSGGMGRVYKAWDLRLSRWVALKFPRAVGDERVAAWFEREARLAAGLSHPNIASIYQQGQAGGERYIAMQFISGRTLEKHPRRDIEGLVGRVRDAARAVAYANSQGIIHRDIKPSNLMATPDGRVFVLDFGLARPVEDDSRISMPGRAVGTPAYMSPEQARGGAVDARSDVYSLGATLYEGLTGRPPFTATTIYETLRQVEEAAPRGLRMSNPRVPSDLETIVLKCLEKDPARRYGTADELADDLERFLKRDPIRARPSGALYRIRLRLAKRKALVVAAAASAVLAAALGWWQFVGRSEADHLRLRESAVTLWAEARGAAMAGGDPEGIPRRAREARAAFERALAAREEPQAHVMRARCLQLEGQDAEAIKALERAHALDPGYAEARIELAKALLARYQDSRGTPQDYTVIDAASADVTVGAKGLPPETADQRGWRERGEKLLAAGGAAPAQEALLKGLLAMGQGEFARAAESLAAYRRVEPWDAKAHGLEGICRYFARDYPGAISALDQSLGRVPSTAGFRWRGLARDASGRYDDAIADYTKAVETDPKFVSAYNLRGLAKSAKGLHEEAIADYERAVALDPARASFVNNLGNAKALLGRHDEAVVHFTKAIELDPRHAGAPNNLGNAKLAQGLVDEAIAAFTKALELDPAHAEAWYNRGRAHSSKGLKDEAIQDYTKAIDLDPRHAKALTNRGLAKSQKGLKDEAIADFSKALEIDPKLPEAWSNRAFAKMAKGLHAEAVADWEKALDVAPPGWPPRVEIQGRLGNVRPARLFQEANRLHELKRYGEAIEKFRNLVDAYPAAKAAVPSAYNIACGYSLLGEKSKALEWLEKAVEMGWKDAAHIEKDTDLESLRGEARYRRIVDSLKGK